MPLTDVSMLCLCPQRLLGGSSHALSPQFWPREMSDPPLMANYIPAVGLTCFFFFPFFCIGADSGKGRLSGCGENRETLLRRRTWGRKSRESVVGPREVLWDVSAGSLVEKLTLSAHSKPVRCVKVQAGTFAWRERLHTAMAAPARHPTDSADLVCLRFPVLRVDVGHPFNTWRCIFPFLSIIFKMHQCCRGEEGGNTSKANTLWGCNSCERRKCFPPSPE